MCFPIFMNEKKSFQTTKKEVKKPEKFRVFLKGLGHGFGQKLDILTFFLLGILGQENVFYDILEQKNAFIGYKNKKFQKVEKLRFLQKG